MRVASAGLAYWVVRFFLLGTKARILGLTIALVCLQRYPFALMYVGNIPYIMLLNEDTLVGVGEHGILA